MEKFWGDRVGWEKVACFSTKMAISLKRVKIIVVPYELYELYDYGKVPELYGTL